MVKDLLSRVGNEVKTLKRIRMSNIKLKTLKEGSWRYLSQSEVHELNGT